ncbi:hypothetical protein LX36DRAFT_208379, partial [Colletotrichum falcatum]
MRLSVYHSRKSMTCARLSLLTADLSVAKETYCLWPRPQVSGRGTGERGTTSRAHKLPIAISDASESKYSTYDHTHRRTRDPVRSPIDKPVRAGLVAGSVTTSEYLVLYVFDLLLSKTR